MGEVYLAVQLGLGRFQKPLALKLLLPHLSESPQAIQMFLDEAQLAARMNHPNVVQIFDVGVAEGRHYIAMELVRGVSMSALIAALKTSNGRVSGTLLAYIGRALCDGLHHAHELMDPDGNRLQVVHRDVTPHNVLLSNEGGVKLTDFGIAKARDSATHTRPGYVKGKFEYVAPEQLLGKPLDRRVDIFGAGLTLYHLATLGSPFRRENELATLNAIERDPLPSLAMLRPDLPRGIREAITKATHKDPNARFPTARALRDALPPVSSEARDELAELVRTLCGDAIAKLESKTADVKAMEGGTSSLEVEDGASAPGNVTGPPNWPPERVTSELSAMPGNTAFGGGPLPPTARRATGGCPARRRSPACPPPWRTTRTTAPPPSSTAEAPAPRATTSRATTAPPPRSSTAARPPGSASIPPAGRRRALAPKRPRTMRRWTRPPSGSRRVRRTRRASPPGPRPRRCPRRRARWRRRRPCSGRCSESPRPRAAARTGPRPARTRRSRARPGTTAR